MQNIEQFISKTDPVSFSKTIAVTDEVISKMCDTLHRYALSRYKFICVVNEGMNMPVAFDSVSNSPIEFEDATYKGSTNTYDVYTSQSIPSGKAYVFILSNGVKYTTSKTHAPEIYVDIDPDYPKDSLKLYGVIS